MKSGDLKNFNSNKEEASFEFKKNADFINENNCFMYEDKNDCFKEDILLKQKDENWNSSNHKPSIDLNLTDKKLHEFLNNDLIKALDNDLLGPEENCEMSDSSSTNAYITCSSEFNSPKENIKISKNKNDINNMNLNTKNCWNENEKDLNDVNKNLSVNKDIIISNENNFNNTNKENRSIKEKIKLLNDPLLAPIFIPKKYNDNFEEVKQKEKKSNKKEKNKNKKEKKNNPFKNKFDDDVEPIIMLSMANIEEKTKLPSEIRAGDWICLYCNNLNFSFRIKCNRCGLLRKSSAHLFKKRYFDNTFKNMANYNSNSNEEFNMYLNNNMNYGLDCNSKNLDINMI